MASGGHVLQQYQAALDNAVRQLTNDDLKKICRSYGSQVSGTKAVLQRRCTDIIEDIVRRGDAKSFDDMRLRAGLRPLQSSQSNSHSNNHLASAYSPHNMAPQRGGGGFAHVPANGKCFKTSPFYDIIETLSPLHDLPEMPQNRHTVRAHLTINPEIANQIRKDDLKILMYCGAAHSMSAYSQCDVAFPNQIEVKVNDHDVKHNYKGLKNKPGSTKPADITAFIRKFGNQQNSIQVTYALTNKRFAFCINLVRYVTADKLVEQIKNANIIPKDQVLRDMNRANADPDIAATSIRMSLKDPISTMRITIPVRSSACTHNQCFDGRMFLELQEQAPQWSCPVCSKHVSFASLCVDKYFEDILNRTSKSIEKVDIEPNGAWRVIKEDEDVQPNGTSSKPRASYDDDFDDIIELDQPTSKSVNGLKREFQGQGMLSPAPGSTTFSFNTPPISSREPSVAQSTSSAQRPSNKRPQSAVIDLTLSDDEDEPPRPAKRPTTNRTQVQNTTSTPSVNYSTPLSLPDSHGRPSNTTNIQTDTYGATGEPTYDQRHLDQRHLPPPNNFSFNFSPQPLPRNSISPAGANPFDTPTWSQYPPLNQQPPTLGSPTWQPGTLRLPPIQDTLPSDSPGPTSFPHGSWRGDWDWGDANYPPSPG